jgi:hypothetical protein
MPIRKVSAILLRVPRPLGPRADSHKAWEKAKAEGRRVPLARCAAVTPPPPLSLRPRSSWQGGSFAPRCIPQSRTFGRCTRPDALRLLDFRPLFRQRLRRGEPSCPPSTSRPGETSLSPWTLIDHGPCPVDPRRRRSAPAPLTNPGRIGCAPLPGALLRPVENKP